MFTGYFHFITQHHQIETSFKVSKHILDDWVWQCLFTSTIGHSAGQATADMYMDSVNKLVEELLILTSVII